MSSPLNFDGIDTKALRSIMPMFTAAVEFDFEAESLEQAGSHLRELATAARTVSFRMTRGEVKPTPPSEDAGPGGSGSGA